MAEYDELTKYEKWRQLREMDSYLAEEGNSPREGKNLEVIREIIRTRKAAIQEVDERSEEP